MYTSANPDVDLAPSRVTAWVGWIFFASVIMIVSGVFSIIWGVVGLVRNEVFVGRHANVINLDYTAWGWINLILGLVVLLAGASLLTGSRWAGVVAIVLAALSAITNLLVLASSPVWSVVVIACDLLVIFAVTVHGDELRKN